MPKNQLILVVVAWLFAASSFAAPPQKILYQGTLRRSGSVYTGNAAFVFRLTDSSGATEYWTSGSTVVPVSMGLFRYPIGVDNAGGTGLSGKHLSGVDWPNITPYIEVTVDGTVLAPREAMASVPYSLSNDDANKLLKTGDAMTGPLTLSGSTLTISGNAFSVGGSSFTVLGGSAAVAYQLTAGSIISGASITASAFFGYGGNLTGLPSSETNTYVSSKTFAGSVLSGGSVTASAFFGYGGNLSGLPSAEANTYASSKTFTANAFSVGGSTLVVAGGNVGIGTTNPATTLEVNGAAQFGLGAAKSTFTSTGDLILAGGSSITLSGANGFIYSQSSVTASAFFGSGAALAGVVASQMNAAGLINGPVASSILPSTVAYTTSANTFTSSQTITADAFSVGGSTLLVSGGNIGIGTTNITSKLTILDGDIRISTTAGSKGLYFQDGSLQTTAAAGGNLWADRGSNNISNTNSGNVGIGTTAPSSALEVAGTTPLLFIRDINDNNPLNAAYIRLGEQSGTDWKGGFMGYSGSNNRLYIGVHGNANFTLADDTKSITMDRANGWVGILTSGDPAAALHVGFGTNVGALNGSNIYMSNYSSSYGSARLVGNWTGTGLWGIGPASGASDESLRIGSVSNTTGTWSSTQNLNLVVGGNVGVGTMTVPGSMLEVMGNGTSVNPDLRITNTEVDGRSWRVGEQIDDAPAGTFSVYDVYADEQRVFISSVGRVGIGTTNPKADFEIAAASSSLFLRDNTGNNGNAYLRFGENSGDWKGGFVSYDGVGNILNLGIHEVANYDYASDVKAMAIYRASGEVNFLANVGIGTSDPSNLLHVNSASGAEGGIVWQDGSNADLKIYRDTDVGDWAAFRTNLGNGIAFIGAPDVTAMVISRSSSNVGIGTNAPQTKLEIREDDGPVVTLVNKDTTISAGDTLGKITFRSEDSSTDGTIVKAFIHAMAEATFTANNHRSGLYFGTAQADVAASTRMVINSDGNIGVSTTTPMSKLHVHDGDIRISTTAGGASRGIIFQDGTTQTTAAGASPVLRQMVSSTTCGLYAAQGTGIPADDTVPQIGEGYKILVATITPTAADSRLEIEAAVWAREGPNVDNDPIVATLFQDNGPSAIAVGLGPTTNSFVAGPPGTTVLKHIVDSTASTAQRNFTINIGATAANAVCVNCSNSNTAIYGGKACSTLTVKEYSP